MAQADMFGVCGRMTAQPGRRDEVVDLIRESVRAGGDASGLIAYSVIATLEEPDTIWVTELWSDKAAHDTMTRSEPVRTVFKRSSHCSLSLPAPTDMSSTRADSARDNRLVVRQCRD